MNFEDLFRRRLDASARTAAALAACADEIAALARVVADAMESGGTLYTCGNGGSAAEAMHLTEELIGCYRSRDRAARPAICLNADPTALTCIANDFGFENVFSRQCEALLTPGDVLLVLSTSGNSANLINALLTARDRGATTIGLLGATGGECAPLCDHALVVPGEDSAHIQEAHLIVVHLICEAVEQRAIGS